MNIRIHLAKVLDNEQEKFKYINPDVEDLRYLLEEHKPKIKDLFITCYKEMNMAGYNIKSKAFTSIHRDYGKLFSGMESYEMWKNYKNFS